MKHAELQELIQIVKELAQKSPSRPIYPVIRDKDMRPWLDQSERDFRNDFKDFYRKEKNPIA